MIGGEIIYGHVALASLTPASSIVSHMKWWASVYPRVFFDTNMFPPSFNEISPLDGLNKFERFSELGKFIAAAQPADTKRNLPAQQAQQAPVSLTSQTAFSSSSEA